MELYLKESGSSINLPPEQLLTVTAINTMVSLPIIREAVLVTIFTPTVRQIIEGDGKTMRRADRE